MLNMFPIPVQFAKKRNIESVISIISVCLSSEFWAGLPLCLKIKDKSRTVCKVFGIHLEFLLVSESGTKIIPLTFKKGHKSKRRKLDFYSDIVWSSMGNAIGKSYFLISLFLALSLRLLFMYYSFAFFSNPLLSFIFPSSPFTVFHFLHASLFTLFLLHRRHPLLRPFPLPFILALSVPGVRRVL